MIRFIPLAVACEHTTSIHLGTAVAIAFARTPMTLAMVAWDLQTVTGGRFVLGLGSQIRPHIEQRYSMPWSEAVPARMRETVVGDRARSGMRGSRVPRSTSEATSTPTLA